MKLKFRAYKWDLLLGCLLLVVASAMPVMVFSGNSAKPEIVAQD